MDREYLSTITSVLLNKYNKNFDNNNKELNKLQKNCERKHNDITNVMKAYLTDLTKLDKDELYTLTKLEKKDYSNQDNICNFKKNIKKIEDINFIEDFALVKKIIQYRIQEVIKEITLIKYYFSVYRYVITGIINLQYKNHNVYDIETGNPINLGSDLNVFNYLPNNNSDLDKKKNRKTTIIYNDKLANLIQLKQEIEGILNQVFINNNKYFLEKTLCKYIFLEEQITKINQKLLLNKNN